MPSIALREEGLLVDELAGLARAYAESQAFVSLLAHELRTRLKVTEWALCCAGEDGLGTARENTRNVQELVTIARNNPGKLSRVLDDLRADVELLEIEILASALPVVALPQGLLETVLRNLLSNALEAGASRVEVYARPDGTICVRDDGPGIPPEQATRIFGACSGKQGGAGLGLTLCREILRSRGAEIWLELPSTFAFRVG